MRLEIRSRGPALGPALQDRIAHRVSRALGRLSPAVERLVIRVHGGVEPRPGDDLRATVQLVPRHGRRADLFSEGAGDHPVAAVGQAVERCARQLRKARARWRQRRKGGRHD